MRKRIILAALAILGLATALFGMKALQIGAMIQSGKASAPPPTTVTSAPVTADTWSDSLSAVGSLVAVQGVTVSAELAGKVAGLQFEAGSAVAKGAVLLRQDTTTEEAQLPGMEAALLLARTNRQRAEQMHAQGIISQSDFDTAVATQVQAQANVDNLKATIGKKTIRAPFSGRLGVRQANLGQMLQPGDPIVTLQTLDPVYVNFNLPQQDLDRVKLGQTVKAASDAGVAAEGKITAISPLVDASTRNMQIQATLVNKGEALRPGMFVTVSVALPTRQAVQVIPATAVLYASYGDSAFVIQDSPAGKILRQQFIRVGERRGDFVSITSGLKAGEQVASTGVFKLRNGAPVVVDNTLSPNFQLLPKPSND